MAFGRDRDKEVLGMLAEVDYVVPFFQQLEIQLQGNSFFHDLSKGRRTDSQIAAGFSYKITPKIALRFGYFGDMHSDQKEKDHQVLLQLYYFAI